MGTILAQANEKLLAAMTAQQHPSHMTQKTTQQQQRQPSSSKRPASPNTDHSESSHKCSKSFHTRDKINNENKPLPACAVCLSHKLHSVPVVECDTNKTWDLKYDMFAKQVNRTLIGKATGQHICSWWQRKDGCSDKHSHVHLCSGCGLSSHGA